LTTSGSILISIVISRNSIARDNEGNLSAVIIPKPEARKFAFCCFVVKLRSWADIEDKGWTEPVVPDKLGFTIPSLRVELVNHSIVDFC
jgi:hypothetical protein